MKLVLIVFEFPIIHQSAALNGSPSCKIQFHRHPGTYAGSKLRLKGRQNFHSQASSAVGTEDHQ